MLSLAVAESGAGSLALRARERSQADKESMGFSRRVALQPSEG